MLIHTIRLLLVEILRQILQSFIHDPCEKEVCMFVRVEVAFAYNRLDMLTACLISFLYPKHQLLGAKYINFRFINVKLHELLITKETVVI